MRQWLTVFLTAGVCLALGIISDRAVLSRKAATLPLSTAACDSRLVAQVAFRNALDFERDNHFVSHLGNCREDGEIQRCSASTEGGAIVAYHCDIDSCSVDCGASK